VNQTSNQSMPAICNSCLSCRGHGIVCAWTLLQICWTHKGCHLGDGRTVCQVGTHGANCGNVNRDGNRIALSQRMVDAPWVAESDCINRDPKFTNVFWKAIMKLRFSMAFHFQMVGKTKRVNGILNQYLKILVDVDQLDWANYVGQVKFSCNVTMHLETKWSFFVGAFGVDVLQPTNLAIKWAYSTLMSNQDGQVLATKCK
jgi:hypothetical protein